MFMSDFRYYIPDEHEIAESKIHTEAADTRADRLSRRFGHPALHAELYTPMVHANMVHLLPQVYHGRLSEDVAGLQEPGGEKANAAPIVGGLNIAGVEEVSPCVCFASGVGIPDNPVLESARI